MLIKVYQDITEEKDINQLKADWLLSMTHRSIIKLTGLFFKKKKKKKKRLQKVLYSK